MRRKNTEFCRSFNIFFQSNSESQLIGWIHQALDEASAIVINPAGYTHTSVAILDALRIFNGPVVEVHLRYYFTERTF